jgi:hypothetical protein
MKLHFALIALLVAGVFAMSFAMAEDAGGEAVVGMTQSSSDVATPISPQEIDGSIDDSVALTQCKRSGFASFQGMTGGLVGNGQGYLTNIALVTSNVVCSSGDMTVAAGRMKFGNTGYRLLQKSVSGNNYVLLVLPSDAKITSIDQAQSLSVGTLTLTLKDDYSGLTSYTAKLQMGVSGNTATFEGMFYAHPEVSIRKAEINGNQGSPQRGAIGNPEKVNAENAEDLKMRTKDGISIAKPAGATQAEGAKLLRQHWWQFWRQSSQNAQVEVAAQ